MFGAVLETVARALGEAGVPYMVIGGQAVLLYGEPRVTRDIDLTLGLAPDSAAQVLNAFAGTDISPMVDSPEEFLRKTFVLPMVHAASGIRVDLIFSFTPYEAQAIRKGRLVRLGQTDVRFASLEDTLVLKLVAGRPRDIEDAKSILRKSAKTDLRYVRKWLKEYDAAAGVDSTGRLEAVLGSVKPRRSRVRRTTRRRV